MIDAPEDYIKKYIDQMNELREQHFRRLRRIDFYTKVGYWTIGIVGFLAIFAPVIIYLIRRYL